MASRSGEKRFSTLARSVSMGSCAVRCRYPSECFQPAIAKICAGAQRPVAVIPAIASACAPPSKGSEGFTALPRARRSAPRWSPGVPPDHSLTSVQVYLIRGKLWSGSRDAAGEERFRRSGSGSIQRDRQVDLEGRALAGLAVDPDRSCALLHDAEGGGESQPGALARLLGGEERLEDACERLLGHPHTRVADRQHHR